MNSPFEMAPIVGSVLASGSLGLFVGFFVGRRWTLLNASKSTEASAEDEKPKARHKLETMMINLHELTSEVGEQVGIHSNRVSEITHLLDSPTNDSPAEIRSAGESLVIANQELSSALKKAEEEIRNQRDELRRSIREARTDALTGLPNRRAFEQELARSIAIYRRKATVFSLVMMDIDHFKQLNDLHGHLVGDQVLKVFAACLQKSYRETDFVSRFGGEEFAAILPETKLSEALIAAERTRYATAHSQYSSNAEVEIKVTASFGVAEIGHERTAADIIKMADEALYAAKKNGRNRSWYHDGSSLHFHEVKPLVANP